MVVEGDEMVVEGDDSIPFFYIGASDQGMYLSQHLRRRDSALLIVSFLFFSVCVLFFSFFFRL